MDKVFVVHWESNDWCNPIETATFAFAYSSREKAAGAVEQAYRDERQMAEEDIGEEDFTWPPLVWAEDGLSAIAGGDAWGWQMEWTIKELDLV